MMSWVSVKSVNVDYRKWSIWEYRLVRILWKKWRGIRVIIKSKVPQLGDKRVIKKFSWLPCKIMNNWVWLEYYWQTEEYGSWYDPMYGSSGRKWFVISRGLDKV